MTRYDFMGPHEIITRHARPRTRGRRTAPLTLSTLPIYQYAKWLDAPFYTVLVEHACPCTVTHNEWACPFWHEWKLLPHYYLFIILDTNFHVIKRYAYLKKRVDFDHETTLHFVLYTSSCTSLTIYVLLPAIFPLLVYNYTLHDTPLGDSMIIMLQCTTKSIPKMYPPCVCGV